jgi:dipeptidyl aminopeptidase/acylaminoacyl peptidase
MFTRIALALGVLLEAPAVALAQNAYIAPADNLVVDGIPPIPIVIKRDVDRYTHARGAELLDWHPTKAEMLIVTSFANVAQVHVVKSPGGARTQLTFFEDRPTSGVSYQPTRGDYFIFRKDSGGDENYQIYRYDFASSAVTLLTDGKSRNSAGVWSHAGDRIAYTSTRRNGQDVDLYVLNPLDPKSGRMVVALQGGGWRALDWSPDDRRILMQEFISINESYLWIVDAASGERTLFTPKNVSPKVAHEDGRFRVDGKAIYVVTDRGGEFRQLASIDIGTGQYHVLTAAIPWDIYLYDVAPDGKTIAVVTNEDGFTVLHLIDAATGKERVVPGRREHLTGVFGLRWHKSGRWLGVTFDSGRLTGDAYSLNVTTGKLEQWTFSETGGIDTKQFVDPELVHWRSVNGRTISGFLYRPPARFTGKRPVIIDIHGGPEEQFQPYFLGRQNYYLNELGVALLFPNIRGSAGYGKSFLKLDNGVLRENAYQDIGALLDWIKTQPTLDADRVMITGSSYGGHAALVTATRYPDRIRCIVDRYGPTNLVTFLEHTADYRRDLRRAEYGDERDSTIRAFLARTAPLTNAAKITKPLFVVQGSNDPIVPPSESEQLMNAVRPRGVPVWYLLVKDGGHGYFNKPARDYEFYATVQFVKTYLLN